MDTLYIRSITYKARTWWDSSLTSFCKTIVCSVSHCPAIVESTLSPCTLDRLKPSIIVRSSSSTSTSGSQVPPHAQPSRYVLVHVVQEDEGEQAGENAEQWAIRAQRQSTSKAQHTSAWQPRCKRFEEVQRSLTIRAALHGASAEDLRIFQHFPYQSVLPCLNCPIGFFSRAESAWHLGAALAVMALTNDRRQALLSIVHCHRMTKEEKPRMMERL